MKIAKLPVLYVPVGYDRPDEPIVASWNSEERSKAAAFHDGICFWTVEPYIPISRVREMLELRLGGGHCCRVHVEMALEQLIADAENDDAKDGC